MSTDAASARRSAIRRWIPMPLLPISVLFSFVCLAPYAAPALLALPCLLVLGTGLGDTSRTPRLLLTSSGDRSPLVLPWLAIALLASVPGYRSSAWALRNMPFRRLWANVLDGVLSCGLATVLVLFVCAALTHLSGSRIKGVGRVAPKPERRRRLAFLA